jgi:hypothetical protein
MRFSGISRSTALLLTATLCLSSPAVYAHAEAASGETTTAPLAQSVAPRIAHALPSVTPAGTFITDVVTRLGAPAEYFEIRLRILRDDGELLYQKTEVRHNVLAGDQTIRFSRALGDLDLKTGRYPLEIRVLATGSLPTEITGSMLVVPDDTTPVPVALIVRYTHSPFVDPNGRFVVDPGTTARPRTDVERLAGLVESNPDLRLSLAIAPQLLEEWMRASDGYETSGPEGVQKVTAAGAGAVASSAALERMRELAANDRVDVLDVPYAEPDLEALERIGALGDLEGQWRLGSSVMEAAIGSSAASGTAFLGDVLPAAGLSALRQHKIAYAVLSRESVNVGEATATSGVYALDGTDVRAVVFDSRLSASIRDENADAFYGMIFDRITSKGPGEPLAILVEIGPGTPDSTADLERAIALLQAAPWIRVVSAEEAAGYGTPGAGTLSTKRAPANAPIGYWTDVALARKNADAVVAALGGDDADARTAQTAVFVAESRSWAGPDGRYSLADRGRAFAISASHYVEDLFSSVRIEARDVTLSNRTGEVPISVINGTGKDLVLDFSASGRSLGTVMTEKRVKLDPGENILTIPIVMDSTISDELTVKLDAGDTTIKSASVRVTASYLDRLATLAMVIVFLLGLLLFIRRRVRSAGAGTMPEEAGRAV